jgi:MOSC domain-containing protein YiiM
MAGPQGTLVSIHIAPAPAAAMVSVARVRAVEGMGLEGDRYFLRTGTFARKWAPDAEVTLIEVEAIEALSRDYQIDLAPGDARRNLVTRGVALNHLVGLEFRVGAVAFRAHGLCEPCGHLAKVTERKVEGPLKHRGGLRAQILRGGVLTVGDAVAVEG